MDTLITDLLTSDLFTFAAIADIGSVVLRIVSVILGLGAVIFFHELGHFAVAKWCDVHVERFSIGMGPIIWSRQWGETEYALSIFPIGGYVKMLGQDDTDPSQMTSDEIAENPRSYSSKKVWQRMAIISAGVIMNVITGFLFHAVAYYDGLVEEVQMIGNVVPGSPAWKQGLRPGDTIEKVNGEDVQNFSEIQQAVILSGSELRVEGKRADGSTLDVTIKPEMHELAQQIGCGPTQTSTISPKAVKEKIIIAGSPAADATGGEFLPGDRIVAVNGEEVSYLHEVVYLAIRDMAKEAKYTIARYPKKQDGTLNLDAEPEEVQITVPARKARSIGLWMAPGKVTAIANGSIAAKAGLQLKDQIIKVDGAEVGKEIDPLTLPIYFAQQGAQNLPVTVTVNRPREGDSPETVELTMNPSDRAGWTEKAIGLYDPEKDAVTRQIALPLTIPSIGAGFQILPRIANIVEGSEASESGKFQIGQKISRITLEQRDKDEIEEDRLGNTETATISLDSADWESNWAWAFQLIQQAPGRKIRVHVEGDESAGAKGFAYLFKTEEQSEDLYVLTRGIGSFESLQRVRVAATPGDAVSLGYRKTRSNLIKIYQTLTSLFGGRLSIRAFSGPVGIGKIAYKQADSGLASLFDFLGFLSINLAVINFLPIPVLDGGHMVFLLYEGVTRRKPNENVIKYAITLGLIMIASLFALVMYLDLFVNN